jgi:hypothetical protein
MALFARPSRRCGPGGARRYRRSGHQSGDAPVSGVATFPWRSTSIPEREDERRRLVHVCPPTGIGRLAAASTGRTRSGSFGVTPRRPQPSRHGRVSYARSRDGRRPCGPSAEVPRVWVFARGAPNLGHVVRWLRGRVSGSARPRSGSSSPTRAAARGPTHGSARWCAGGLARLRRQ